MTREQLAHVLRAAARIAEDPDVVVIGSQSILGSFPEDRLPAAVRCWQVGFRRCRPTPESCNASSIGSAAGTPAGMLAGAEASRKPRGVADRADLRLRTGFSQSDGKD
jgi:hypothetical protein